MNNHYYEILESVSAAVMSSGRVEKILEMMGAPNSKSSKIADEIRVKSDTGIKVVDSNPLNKEMDAIKIKMTTWLKENPPPRLTELLAGVDGPPVDKHRTNIAEGHWQ